MRISQELLNQCDEFQSLIEKCLPNANSAQRAKIQKIVMSVYAVSCGALVITINHIAGTGTQNIKIDTNGISKLLDKVNIKEYSLYSVNNLKQYQKWMNVDVSDQAYVKIRKFGVKIHDLLDQSNAKLHSLLKTVA